MRARLVLVSLLLAACTSHSAAGPTATPTPDHCPGPGCLTNIPGSSAYPYPADAGHISPLPVPGAFEGELARKDNNVNAGIRTTTIVVTVPAGRVLATDLICQGRGEVVVTSRPTSPAAQTIRCDGNAIPSQQGAVATQPAAVTTRYVFTLRATGPSRWLLAVSARTSQ